MDSNMSSVLFLKTSDISTAATATASSNNGYWTNGRAVQTFYVNLRNLLGSKVYDNNKYFKLRLNVFTSNSGTGAGWTNFFGDYSPHIFLKGLNFVNNALWQPTEQNTNAFYGVPLGQVNLTDIINAFTIFTEDTASVYFAKTTESVELTLSFVRMYFDGGIIDTTNVLGANGCMPFSTFSFQISALPKNPLPMNVTIKPALKSNLVVRVVDILPGGPGTASVLTVGEVTQNGAQATWLMNWKALLGNSYDEYSVFAIRLSMFHNTQVNFSSVAANTIASINVSGLNWINNGYRSSIQNNTAQCPLAITNVLSNAGNFVSFGNDTAIAWFSRPGIYDPLTIGLYQLTSNNFITNTSGAGIPLFSCFFDVYPVY
jgi:hypothetical protein